MKRSRRAALAVLVLSVILVVGIAASAYAAFAYIHQEGGSQSYNYQSWLVTDSPAVAVTAEGVFNLNNSQVATWADNYDYGDTGSLKEPTAFGTIMADDRSRLTIDHTNIYSFGSAQFQGPQVVFASGSGTLISLTDCLVYGDPLAARGLYVQQGADIAAEQCQIVTNASWEGAAVATGYDGGGYIRLHDCQVDSWGGGNSPAVYSSAAVFVNESKLYAHESEAAWLDGGGDLTLSFRPSEEKYALVVYDSSLYSLKSQGVSFAKSLLGVVSDDDRSRFLMMNGYLEAAKELFYAPNSKANIVLYNVDAKSGTGVVLNTKWSGSGPGGGVPTTDELRPGSRESDVVLESVGSRLHGDIITDVDEYTRKPSVVSFIMYNWASFEGAINVADQGAVNLTMAKEAVWDVTADSYIGTLNVPTVNTVNSSAFYRNNYSFTPDLSNIHSNGHTVYYDEFSNYSLATIKYQLPGGGWLVPAPATGIAGLWRYGD